MDVEQIYIAHFAKMKRFAREYVLYEEDAENIVQDVFLELWERKEAVFMPANLIAFLFSAVRNKCIDHLRHKIVTRDTIGKLREEQIILFRMKYESLEAFDQSILSEDNIEAVLKSAIETLPERCRDIFIKSRMEGKKQKEIASELNISINTVESQMAIAYKKLRDELKDYLPLLFFLFI